MPGGRPPKYKPEYCEQVIKLGAEGMSQVEISAEMDIPRSTMHSWAEQHEEFSAALVRAKELEQAWFERQGRAGLHSREFNAPVWKKSVESRFRDDYTERKEVKTEGSLDLKSYSTEQLKDMIKKIGDE